MKVNGKVYEFKDEITISKLLEHLNLKQDLVVVELNFKIVPKEEYKAIILNDDDNLEIVSFVGGG
ncbi:sulfur carrier protein ThiS [Clostridium ihumii]|uniref:sulfur carrier protein ThiS n=1 Tax=Clostridium ihumii TaxID=1470356 RepID=UPI0005597B8B|nr:sulfur carrier protein ThiS [Clostridium ihumii]